MIGRLSFHLRTNECAGTVFKRLALTRVTSPFSLPVLGETDAPAPVRAKEWVKGEGEGEGCSKRVAPRGVLEPLTLILSLWPK